MFARLYKSNGPTRCHLQHIETSSSEGSTEVLISHAQLYVFAEKFDIRALKELVLKRLHKALLEFELQLERTREILILIRYVYENTAENSSHEEPLRALICCYIRYQMEEVLDKPDLVHLAVDLPEFLQDFFKQILTRLH